MSNKYYAIYGTKDKNGECFEIGTVDAFSAKFEINDGCLFVYEGNKLLYIFGRWIWTTVQLLETE